MFRGHPAIDPFGAEPSLEKQLETLSVQNKAQLVEVLGAVTEMAESVAKSPAASWKHVKDTVQFMGERMLRSSMFTQFQSTMMMPATMMTSNLMFGIEGMLVPYTNIMRQSTAMITQALREPLQTYQTGAAIGGLIGSVIGMYWGPFGMMAGGMGGALLGMAIEKGITDPWDIHKGRRVRAKSRGGKYAYYDDPVLEGGAGISTSTAAMRFNVISTRPKTRYEEAQWY